ncbi:transketolase family protein, partial [Eubacteriales bacterium OttesenSCG-928-A19]|nr:transketolase family protein [Eubacteriales bacterium OttesenSCG-928-A19]
MRALTRYLAASDVPAYVRVGRGAVPGIYDEGVSAFTPGKANRLRTGRDASIIACGEMVHPALLAEDLLLKDGISVSVYDFCSIKPLDTDAILEAAENGLVVTAEEHSVHGGLGGAVAEVLAQHKPTRQLLLGLPDEA